MVSHNLEDLTQYISRLERKVQDIYIYISSANLVIACGETQSGNAKPPFSKAFLKQWSWNIQAQFETSTKCIEETLYNILGVDCHFVISNELKL